MPMTASDFIAGNLVASLAMIASSFVLAALLWSGRALLLNILIAFYVFRVYMTRPYINLFLPKLRGGQYAYICSLNSYYNPSDSSVVYLSLLSLLSAWLIGLYIAKPKPVVMGSPPWIFRQIDEIVTSASWPFWTAWILLTILNYKSPSDTWQGIATGESSTLFAFGLFSMATINVVCLYVLLLSRQTRAKPASIMLIAPILISSVFRSAGGSRSAIFFAAIFAATYWLFLNLNKRVSRGDLAKTIFIALLFPVILFAGLFAQYLRPFLRSGTTNEAIWTMSVEGLDIFNPDNPIINSLYFGLTELAHRLSSLKAQFLILNDHFIHPPWASYNPLQAFMRIINDLLPGDIFPNMLTINQLFDYIYSDSHVIYNSESWSIQGTLYLYCGLWLSPIVVFFMSYLIRRNYQKLQTLATASPSFAAFFILLFNDILENGTIERIVPVDIVRPMAGFVAFIFLVKIFQALYPQRKKSPLSMTH